MDTHYVDCQNCEQPFTKGFKFCPHCGQKTNENLTIGVLFYNTISNYFSFDARFLKSFFPLMFKPGYLAKRFLQGKRLMYLHPAQMYLFVSVIFFFVFSFTISDWSKEMNAFNQKIVKAELAKESPEVSILQGEELDSIKKEELLNNLKRNKTLFRLTDEDLKKTDSILNADDSNALNIDWGFNKSKIDSLVAFGASDAEIYKEMGMKDDAGFIEKKFFKSILNISKGYGAGSIIQRAFDAVPIAMFILLPLFAFLLKLFYYNSGSYAYHLVFSFYFFSFLFTLFALLLGINRFLFEIPNWISWVLVLSTFFYFYLSVLNFYERNWFTSFLKSSIITFIFMLFIIPTAGTLLVIFGFINA